MTLVEGNVKNKRRRALIAHNILEDKEKTILYEGETITIGGGQYSFLVTRIDSNGRVILKADKRTKKRLFR